jgi:hypothetical protein
MGANQRQNSKVVKRCGLSVKKNENSLPLLDVFFKLKTHYMPQKKDDNLSQTQPSQDPSNVNYHTGSIVEF